MSHLPCFLMRWLKEQGRQQMKDPIVGIRAEAAVLGHLLGWEHLGLREPPASREEWATSQPQPASTF